MDLLGSLPHHDVLFPCIFSRLAVEELFTLRLVSTRFRQLVEEFFSRCSEFDFSKMKKKGNANAFRLMTEGNTSLQRLCLSGATHWLTDDLLLPVIVSCNMLSNIDLSHCSQLTNRVLSAMATHCHQLTALSLSGCHWVDETNFQLLVSSNPGLAHVNLASCWSLSDESICFCATACPNLKTLKLTNIYAITNNTLTTIASSCPKLKTLAVNGCWRITNDGIRAIGEYCSKLRTLLVSDCRDVTEASLARLRVRGIEIDVATTPAGTLRRLESTFRYARPYINLQT